jgi:hypothetical protein
MRMSSSGLMSATSWNTGLPSTLANRSQTMLTTAPVPQMDRSLVGTNPVQLAVAGDVTPEPAWIFPDPVKFKSNDARRQCFDHRADNFVAAPDGKRQAMAFGNLVGTQHDIGGRITHIWIHGIRTIELCQGRKAQIICGE